MKLRLDPVGRERVVFFNYAARESPRRSRPQLILVRPNETPMSHFFSGRFWENLGVSTLTTYLEQHGVKFGVLEASLFQTGRAAVARLVGCYAPAFVGISVFSTDMLEECLQIARAVKALQPASIIVLGGHGASFVHEEILERNPAVDVVVRGEAEQSLRDLVLAPSCAEWAEIPNLSYRSAGGVVSNPTRPVTRDIDEAPLPHRFVRDLVSQDEVLSKSPLMMISSRGCFDRCAFCTITKFYGNTWRGRSPRHVVDELEEIVRRYGRRSVHFWDDTFIGPGPRGRRRAIEIAEEIKRRDLDITFHVTTRPTDLTEDVIVALAGAGLRSVFLGVESADQGVLDYFNKHADVDDSTRAIDLLWKHGVHRILAGFILFHPLATWETIARDLDFLDGLPYIEISRIVSRLTYYPGAQMWLEHKHELGPDSYKQYLMPALADPELEALYRVCLSFHNHTLSVESVMVCLEEQYLHDIKTIDFIAACRKRLFHFISARVRRIIARLRAGEPVEVEERVLREQIYAESLLVIDALKQAITDEYLDLLLKAHLIDGYKRFMTPAAPPRRRGRSGADAGRAVS